MASGSFGTASSNLAISSPTFIGAVKDEWQLFSDREQDYVIGSPIGFGASSIVYAATYQPTAFNQSAPLPPPIACALKVLDLDALPPRSLALLQRETTLMSLSKHPNVLRVRGSWMTGHKLFIALRLMNKGSAADVMRYGWPGGMEEDVVRCILRQALQGLNYLHINGFIHRDIKAANLLIDDDGTVLLGDLGVAADLAEDTSLHIPASKVSRKTAAAALSHSDSHPSHSSGSSGHSGTPKRVVLFDNTIPIVDRPRMGKRKSFVGTPCWMAPELIQGRQYDSSADIWSFGITALELTQGRPPRSRETPQRVLLRTIQDDPPTLDREGGTYKYSRAFKEMIDSCLIKDPIKRPTAHDLLQTPFFKAAKKKSYLVGAILKDLPPLTQRQERRVAKNSQTMYSLDSWDFAATTLHPGTPGIYQRTLVEDANLTGEPPEADGVFEMDGDATDNLRDRERPQHSDSVFWSGEDNRADEVEEVDPSIPPSSPSDSDATEANRTGSSPPSSPISVNETATLNMNISTHEVLFDKVTVKRSDSGKSRQLLPVSSSAPVSHSSVLPSSLVSRHKKGLWHKVKSGVRRTASRSDLFEHASQTSEKEKTSRWHGLS